jgi:hypothetical protein
VPVDGDDQISRAQPAGRGEALDHGANLRAAGEDLDPVAERTQRDRRGVLLRLPHRSKLGAAVFLLVLPGCPNL